MINVRYGIIVMVAFSLTAVGWADPYTHFLFEQYGPQGSGSRLSLASVTEESMSSRDIYLGMASIPLCIVNGVAYEPSHAGQLSAIDLATGQRRYIAPGTSPGTVFAYANTKIYAVVPGKEKKAILRIYDLAKQTYRDLMTISEWDVHRCPNINISPDGEKLAYLTARNEDGYQLRVVNLRTKEVKEAGAPIRFVPWPYSSVPMYPPHVWIDKRILLVASQEKLGKSTTSYSLGPAQVSLTAVDSATGESRKVASLAETRSPARVGLYMPLDGYPTLVVKGASFYDPKRYRVDLNSSTLIALADPPPLDEHRSGDFRFAGNSSPQKVFHRDKLIEQAKHIMGMGVSPDGRSAVWSITDSLAGPDDWELRYYNADEKIVRTVEGANPIRRPVLWLSENDLIPQKETLSKPVDGWQAFSFTHAP